MNVAFIPVRGGSKSIPLKNIRPLNGKPLLYWTMKAACCCIYIDKVYIATDSAQIRAVVNDIKSGSEQLLFQKAEVIGRSAASASDTASTETAMMEFASSYAFDNIVLVQATSPLLTAQDLHRGFEAFAEPGTDSVLSVVRQKRFHWEVCENGFAQPYNYDVFHRPRRQDFEGYLVENGAFYISSRKNLMQSQNRVSGNIKAVEMKEDTFFEIDEPNDWVIVESLLKRHSTSTAVQRPALFIPEIKLFLTDCDGCLTDGGMYYSESGDEAKKFNTRDSAGFTMLQQRGILTGIVTGESVLLNRRRAEKLHLDIIETGCKDKPAAVKRICKERNLSLEQVAFIGDDLNDLDTIKGVGLGCCPADAIPQVREAADYIAQKNGGDGVIREVAEMIIRQSTDKNGGIHP